MLELIHQLEQIDTEAFLYLNSMHCELLDYFMVLVSQRFTWIPFYAAFVFVLAFNFHWKVTVTTILAVALVVLLADQTASGLLKPLVGRLRPSNLNNPISTLVHVVDGYRGGRHGFPSSHAANSWGVAIFAMYLVKNKCLSLFLAFWALIVSYSRIYLGVHYTGDILVGVLIGFIMASLIYWGYNRLLSKHAAAFRLKDRDKIKYDYLPITIGAASFAVMLAISIVHCL